MPRRRIDRWNRVSQTTCSFNTSILCMPYARTNGNTYIKPQPSLMFPQPIKQQVPVHLRLDQHQVDEQHHEIVFDVFVRELLAYGALGQADAFAEGAVVGFGVGRVECAHRGAA